jgi:hypothetical protein
LRNFAVYVTAVAGAVTAGCAAVFTPSDQCWNLIVPLDVVCGVGALKSFCDPTITVLVNGARDVEPLNVTDRPVGFVWKESVVVRGKSATFAVRVTPSLSVADRTSSSSEG